MGRPTNKEAKKHPLYGQLNGEVPWLDGCKEYGRETCVDCPVALEQCPAENPRLHKGGRPKLKIKTEEPLSDNRKRSK